jgi:predicted NBD/HSP70 family sugar kinase/DNA-binding CsgD family transcriptional regulator
MGTKNIQLRRPARTNPRRFKIKHETIAHLEGDLLRRVRAGEGLSRSELARGLNLAPSTVGIYVDHLIEEGFLSEGKRVGREFGRPPTALGLNAQGGRFIGVDFEARNIMATAVDFSQKPLKQFHDAIAESDSVDQILEKIEHAIREVKAGDARRVLAIGVGVPGVIDPEHGVARQYKHIRGWNDIPLVERLTARFSVPVFLENNIRSMALAELWFGQGRGLQDFICLGMRSGIGAGIIIDGHIYHGGNNLAGEIGDWPCALAALNTPGRPGHLPTLEEVVSLRGIQAFLAANGGANPLHAQLGAEFNLAQLLKAARDGDETIVKLLQRVALTLGLVTCQLNRAFNPDKIILAGAFPAFGAAFLEQVKKSFQEFCPSDDAPRLVVSDLGEFNGALGAAALAVHEWKPAANKQRS